MRIPLLLLGCLLLIGASGCGGGGDSSEADTGPLVTYVRTGGIAAMPERLVVESDGAASLEVGDDAEPQRFTLSDDELEALRADLDAAELTGIESGPGGCADCYVYEVSYAGQRASFDDSASAPESVSRAVARLQGIAEANYPSQTPLPPIVN